MYPINEYILHDLYPLAKITKSEYWRLLLLLLRGFEVWKTWLTYFHQLQIQNEFHINNRCLPILCMYCTNDFLNVLENPFYTLCTFSTLNRPRITVLCPRYNTVLQLLFSIFGLRNQKWKEIKLFFIQISWVDTWYVVFLKCVSTLHLMYFLIMYFDTTVLYFKENGFPL